MNLCSFNKVGEPASYDNISQHFEKWVRVTTSYDHKRQYLTNDGKKSGARGWRKTKLK